MNDPGLSRQAALHYLRTPLGALWKWEEQGSVVVWHDGSTVAFGQEIKELLFALASPGLPPFSEVILLLAACRGKFPSVPATVQAMLPARGRLIHALGVQQHTAAVAILSRLQNLAPELIAQTRGKILLATTVFETATRFSPIESAMIAEGLASTFSDEELNTLPPGFTPVDVVQSLRNLSEGVRPHTAESLLLRLRTGLDALPKEAPALELPSQDQAQRLLATLATSDHLAGLARVARDLMAALHLPRVIAQADDIPTGGASDLGNRGSLDRLLISELAHDDLTLASRVALNEALYLRREPPARRPERALVVLLDAGLRMWGIPRVLATAAALALVARHRSDRPAQLWRAGNNGLVPLNLLTQPGLEEHLSVLETYLQPTAAVLQLQLALARSPEVDVVVATHRDALADPAFQAGLAEARFDRGFLLAVDREGLVELHTLPWGRPRPLAQAQIDVQRLFEPASAKARPVPLVPLVNPENASDFPAIFRERVFPLLLPVQSKLQQIIRYREGGVCVTADRRLFRWEKPGFGARQLLTELPGSRTAWLGCDSAGRTVVVRTRGKDGRVCVVTVPAEATAPVVTSLHSALTPVAAWIDQEVLLVVLPKQITTISTRTGEILGETPYPEGSDWLNGRYFRAGPTLTFASWNGHLVCWEPLLAGRNLKRDEIFTVFDVKGVGPWMLTHDGRVLSPAGHEFAKTGMTVRDVRISPGGERLVILDGKKNCWQFVTLDGSQNKVRISPALRPTDNPTPNLSPPSRTLQNHFSTIAVTDGICIRLRTTKGKWLETFAFPERLVLVETISEHQPPETAQQPFVSTTTPLRFGCTLKRARWPNGSSAWLDSRGLLHLRSHDQTVPEITLALFHSSLAGWCSDGQRSGPAFFHGADHDVKPVRKALENFCQRLC